MAIYNLDSKLSDIILKEPSLITVINRFDIFLGVGDKNIKEICIENSLDADFFLTILNTYINNEYFPEKILKSFDVKKIVDYLIKTNLYYQHFQIPNIERHFNSLISRSDSDNNNLSLLRKFFLEMKQELLTRIENDTTEWFPKVLELNENSKVNNGEGEEITLSHTNSEQHPIEDKLNDLKSFFIIHLKGNYDHNLCYAVIAAIYTLEKDIKQNNRIRDRILKPMTQALFNSISHD